jgi:drug/metabolite transporter (DMT)-like permease
LLVAAGYLLLTIVWGTTWYAIRVQVQELPLLSGAGVRFLLAGSALWLLESLARKGRPRVAGRWFLVGLSFTSISVPYALLYWAETRITSGLTSVLYAVSPILTSVIAHFVLRGEGLSVLKCAGLVLGFGGIALIMGSRETGSGGGDGGAFWAKAAVVGGAALHVVSSVLIKRLGPGIEPLRITRFTALAGGLTLAVAGVLAGERPDRGGASAEGLVALAYLALVGTGFALTLYYSLLRRLPASVMSLLAFLTPVTALVVGRALDDERLRAESWGYVAMVLAGVLLVVADAWRRRPG